MAKRDFCALAFLLVAVAVSRPGAPVPLSLGASVFFLAFLPFPGDALKNDHFRLATAGVTFLLPDGRDVGSEAVGTDPKTGIIR